MAVTNVSGVAVPAESTTAYGHIISEHNVKTHELAGDTEAAVREYFSDIPVMIEIARCESTFRHTLSDGSVLKGYVDNADTGVMQINQRYHLKSAQALGLDVYDLYDNMEYARYLYERQGTQPWSASAPCWSRSLAMR